jgi:hypothetical protein
MIPRRTRARLLLATAAAILLITYKLHRYYHPPAIPTEELTALYTAQPADADRRYKDRDLTIRGKPIAIHPLIEAPSLLLQLETPPGQLQLYCHFVTTSPEHLASFDQHLNRPVQIRGTCNGREDRWIVLQNCQLLD